MGAGVDLSLLRPPCSPPIFPTLLLRPPQVYELKKAEIDAALDKARAHLTQFNDRYLHKVVSRIPRYTPAKPAESSSAQKEE